MGFRDVLKSVQFRLNPAPVLNDLQKQLQIAMDGLIRAETADPFGTDTSEVYPRWRFGWLMMEQMVKDSDILATVQNAIRREVFRNSIKLSKAESNTDNISNSQDFLQGGDDKTQFNILRFLERCNENGQSYLQVCKKIEDDLNTFDNGWMQFMVVYQFDRAGRVMREKDPLDPEKILPVMELQQIKRVHPAFMGLVINDEDRPGYDNNGSMLVACPVHRNTLHQKREDQEYVACPQCGRECLQAFYCYHVGSGKTYFFEHEMEHQSIYRPDVRLGYPPVLTVWMKVRTLLYTDKFIMDAYEKQRSPKQMLLFNTSNQGMLNKAWEDMKRRARENPHLPAILSIPQANTAGGRKVAELFNFMMTLDEMQYAEMYDSMRRAIGGVYGVMPMFSADVSTGAGLNNEGMQVTVTNRTVEDHQTLWNEHFFKATMRMLHYPEFLLQLNPSEEQDEQAKLDRLQKNLEIGKLATELGLKAKFDADTQSVFIKDGDIEKPAPAPNPFGAPAPGEGTPEDLREESGSPAEPDVRKSHGTKKKSSEYLNSDKVFDLCKADPRAPFTNLAKIIKEEIAKFINKFSRRPSEQELSEAIAKLHLKLTDDLHGSVRRQFKKIYDYEMDRLGKELKVGMAFTAHDEDALAVLENQRVLQESFAGLTNELSGKLNTIIEDAYRTGQLDPKEIEDKIKAAADVSDFRAETIARTETSKVQSAARLTSYKKLDQFDAQLFEHIGPNDHRTTDTSKRIVARTKGGVPWDQYVQIVTEEAAKDFPEWTVNPLFPVSHYNSRHVFRRVVKF